MFENEYFMGEFSDLIVNTLFLDEVIILKSFGPFIKDEQYYCGRVSVDFRNNEIEYRFAKTFTDCVLNQWILYTKPLFG